MKSSSLVSWAVWLLPSVGGRLRFLVPSAGRLPFAKESSFWRSRGRRRVFRLHCRRCGGTARLLSHGTEVRWSMPIAGRGRQYYRLKRDTESPWFRNLATDSISDGDAGQAVNFRSETLKTVGRVKADRDADSIVSIQPRSGYSFQWRTQHLYGDRSRERDGGGDSSLVALPSKRSPM